MNKTLTVICPSYNEESNVDNTVKNILAAIDKSFEDYELLLFDDGSTDKTGQLIDALASQNPKIKAIHNAGNRGFGYCCSEGVKLAKMYYISILPGDNEISSRSIKDMFDLVGVADIIAPFTMNVEVRPRSRIIISNTYIYIMNLLFRCDLHYYTGPAIHKRELLLKFPLHTNSFAFMTAALVKLVRSGHTFVETPIYTRSRKHGKSKAFKLKNVVNVLFTVAKLFWEVEISAREQYYNFPVKRVMPDYEN